MESLMRIAAAVISTTVFSGLLGLGLAVASRRFRVSGNNKTVDQITAALPALNCGACGYSGCQGYAEALASGEETDAGKCTPGGTDTTAAVADLLGLNAEAKTPMVARLACMGGDDVAVHSFEYKGYQDCEAAWTHFQGYKACKYSCLGLGTCVKSCPVDAISHTANGLVEVNPQKCIGCEICVKVCPPQVMKMIPANATWFVACNSKDSAKVTKGNCKVGCIGCKICEKKFPESGFTVADNLSVMKYKQVDTRGEHEAAEACPPKCIVKIDR